MSTVGSNFIQNIITEDIANGKTKVLTRFPPEPKRVSSYRTREIHLPKFRFGEKQ